MAQIKLTKKLPVAKKIGHKNHPKKLQWTIYILRREVGGSKKPQNNLTKSPKNRKIRTTDIELQGGSELKKDIF